MKRQSRPSRPSRVTLVTVFALAVVFAGVGTLPSPLAVAPQTGQGGPGSWPPSDEIIAYPEEIMVPGDPVVQDQLRRSHAGIRSFLRQRPGWTATVDPRSGSIDRAFGDGLFVVTAPGEPGDARRIGRVFLDQHRALIAGGIDADNELEIEGVVEPPGGSVRIVRFRQQRHGLPVLGAGLSLGLRDERVVLISGRALSAIATSPVPALDAREAVDRLALHTGFGRTAYGALVTRREPELAYYPRPAGSIPGGGLRHHLVWILEAKPPEAPFHEWFIAYVDAHDGTVLALFPEAQRATTCDADPEQAHATVRGGVRPNRATDAEAVRPLPFARVEVDGFVGMTGVNGRYPYAGGSSTSRLDGVDFKATCDNCTMPISVLAAADESGDIDFGTGGGSSGTPTFGNGTSTPADRSAFFHLNEIRQLLAKWDNDNFDRIETVVNIQATCNAFSSAHMLGFYQTGNGCRNTGEIRDVVDHELGHTWDRFDGNGITSSAMSEWKSDMLAVLMGGDPCIGESFRIGTVVPPPTGTCDGVRDMDEKAPGRTDLPLTPAECPTCATLKTNSSNPCGGSVHCNGSIVGQAVWHLYNNLLTGNDYITGAPMPAGNPAFTVQQARWLLERLLIAGGPPMEAFNPASAGVSAYDAIMLMDDDDANLANGTPNAAYINAAFVHHEVAETPLIGDSANCPSPSDPLPAATVEIDPDTALPMVKIEWTPAGGGTTFDVLRNLNATDAFLPVAQDVSAGPVYDEGVHAGMTYNYLVLAVEKSGCAASSPGSGIMTVTVSEPDLRIASRVLAEVPGSSDGDGLLEPGERVSVSIELEERAGSMGATGVSATVSTVSPSSPVTSPGPAAFGAIPASSSAVGSTDFEVFIGPSEPCGGSVRVTLAATGNEGCWLDGFEIPIDGSPSCAASASAFVEVVPGSIQVAAAGGDADGIADNCEVTSVIYDIRNNGSVSSGPASSTVIGAGPGVTIAPPPLCAVADLAPGASATCGFSFSLGGSAGESIPFTLVADSAANPSPSALDLALPSESNPPFFSTLAYGFNGALEGWSGMNWSVSTVRTSEGSHSIQAGSTTVNNICGRLTSPTFLLDPANASTLSFDTFINIEPFSSGVWWDRANVHIIDVETGQHLEIPPASGPAYNASGNPEGGLCHITGQAAWAGSLGGFSTATFDLSAWAGRRIRVEFNYESDEGDDREGIYIDDVTLTNATDDVAPFDPQADVCLLPEVSQPAAGIPFDVNEGPAGIIEFTWEDLGPGLTYNLYAGTAGAYYTHGPTPVACDALGAGAACDGTACAFLHPAAALPPGNLYFLVTAGGFGAEGTSGFSTAPSERDPAQSTCVP